MLKRVFGFIMYLLIFFMFILAIIYFTINPFISNLKQYGFKYTEIQYSEIPTIIHNKILAKNIIIDRYNFSRDGKYKYTDTRFKNGEVVKLGSPYVDNVIREVEPNFPVNAYKGAKVYNDNGTYSLVNKPVIKPIQRAVKPRQIQYNTPVQTQQSPQEQPQVQQQEQVQQQNVQQTNPVTNQESSMMQTTVQPPTQVSNTTVVSKQSSSNSMTQTIVQYGS